MKEDSYLDLCKKKRVRFFAWTVAALFFAVALSGCQTRKETVTLTMWHVYGGQTDSPLNDMIEEFNETVGKEKGINIQVTSVSDTNTIHEAVLAATNQEPGASPLPDMFISYPKAVLSMPDSGILVDYQDYFSEEELNGYIPAFVEEGKIDGKFYVFPVAKSTEIMFINKTIFDRFSKETGADEEKLKTWDGLFSMAKDYYAWTDAKTPDIENDGKAFFVHDYHFNYFQVGVASLGDDFFDENQKINFGNTFDRVWRPYADAAIHGGVWLYEGYATDPLRVGEAIVSVASSASVLYYEDTVIYPDNTSEAAEMIARPVPVFEEGDKLVMQRGAGFCTVKSTKERELAAVEFLKWITEPENNRRFVTKVGYMPVTYKGFEGLEDLAKTLEDPKYRSLFQAIADTQKEYTFYTPPKLSNYLDTEVAFERNVRLELAAGRENFLKGSEDHEDSETAMDKVLESFKYLMR